MTAAPNGWSWDLLRAFRDGERWALEDVYRAHCREVASMLSSGFAFQTKDRWHNFVGYRSPFDLQDALQETFRLAFEPSARVGYDGLRPYGPYLRTIGRNVVLKAFRSRESLFPAVPGASPDDAHVPPEIAEASPSPEDVASQRQIDDVVRGFLAALDPIDRQLLELRFVDGLSQRDVADRLKLGRQRVRTREVHLRRELVALMRRQDAGLAVSAAATLVLLTATLVLMGRNGGP